MNRSTNQYFLNPEKSTRNKLLCLFQGTGACSNNFLHLTGNAGLFEVLYGSKSFFLLSVFSDALPAGERLVMRIMILIEIG
jgi:hypothetical protein